MVLQFASGRFAAWAADNFDNVGMMLMSSQGSPSNSFSNRLLMRSVSVMAVINFVELREILMLLYGRHRSYGRELGELNTKSELRIPKIGLTQEF